MELNLHLKTLVQISVTLLYLTSCTNEEETSLRVASKKDSLAGSQVTQEGSADIKRVEESNIQPLGEEPVDSSFNESEVSENPEIKGDVENSDKDTESALGDTSPMPPGITINDNAVSIREETFKTSSRESMTQSVSLTNEGIQVEFAMEKLQRKRILESTQLTRPMGTQIYTQGNPGQVYNKVYTQEAKLKPLDILLVVDNSGSMADEQSNLANTISALLTPIKDTDWRIGITTTNDYIFEGNTVVDNPICLEVLIKAGDSNIEDTLRSTISAMEANELYGLEAGFLRSVRGLSCTTYPDWVRADSSISVLIVSDEDNCSDNGKDCAMRDSDGNPIPNPEGGYYWYPEGKPEFLKDYLTQTIGRILGVNAKFYGIFSHPSQPCSSATSIGTQYAQLVTESGGTWGDICDTDYTSSLTKISQDIALALSEQILLDHVPEPGSVTINVNGAPYSNFTVEGKAVKFATAPAENATVSINYTSGSSPIVSRFLIADPFVQGTVTVNIDGNTVASDQYTELANGVEFTSPPSAGASISLAYRQEAPLPKSWNIDPEALTETIKPHISGLPVEAFQYDATNGIVTFDVAPMDGAAIKIDYELPSIPILDYPIMVEGNPLPTAVRLENPGQVPFEYTIENSTIMIKPDSFVEGAKVIVDLEKTAATKSEIPLSQLPYPESLKVETTLPDCAMGQGITLIEQKIQLKCPILDTAELTISYDYESEPKTSFELSAEVAPTEQIEVTMDGNLIQHTLDGKTVTLVGPVPKSKIVVVKISSSGS